jgi:hypothetical protein
MTTVTAKKSNDIVLNVLWNQSPTGLKASGILQNNGTFDEFKALPDVVTITNWDSFHQREITMVKRGWNSDSCTVYYSELEGTEAVAKAVKS